jgi:hypothetical protein
MKFSAEMKKGMMFKGIRVIHSPHADGTYLVDISMMNDLFGVKGSKISDFKWDMTGEPPYKATPHYEPKPSLPKGMTMIDTPKFKYPPIQCIPGASPSSKKAKKKKAKVKKGKRLIKL